MRLILVFIFSFSVFAQDLVISTTQIPGLVYPKGNFHSGEFIYWIKDISSELGIKSKIEVLPPKRGVISFIEGRVDGLFPVTDTHTSLIPVKFCKTESIGRKRDFIFYKNTKEAHKLSDLYRKNVALTLGYPYSKDILDNKKIVKKFLPTDKANLTTLSHGRVDFAIVEEFTGLLTLKQNKIKNISYDKNHPVSDEEIFFIFSTKKDKEICNKVDRAISKLFKFKKRKRYNDYIEKLVDEYLKELNQ